MSIKGVLFDLDGTALDTEPSYEHAISQACESYNVTYEWDLQQKVMGKPEKEGTRDEHLEEALTKCEPRSGVLEVLEVLRKRFSGKMAIATSSYRKYLRLKQSNNAKLFSYFDAITCGDDEAVKGRGKPLPDIWHVTAAKLGLSASDCIAFEDSEAGVASAVSAGCALVVCTPDPRLDRSRFKAAHVVLDDLVGWDPIAALSHL